MTAARSAFDIVIAGGSYAGLALGLALARVLGTGVEIAVVERRPLTGTGGTEGSDPRAFAIAAGSRALLAALGLWPQLEDAAQAVVGIDITDSRLEDAVRPVLLSYDNVTDGVAQTHILPAARLERALLGAVRDEASITIFANSEIRGLTQDVGGVRLALADGTRVEARLAVAADGARSQVRLAAGIGVNEGRYGQTGIVATVGHEVAHEGRAVQHFLPAGPFALLPLPGRRSCLTWSEGERRAAEIMALDDAGFLAEAQARAGWRLGELTLEGPRAAWPLVARTARRLHAGRVALIGDAARSVHPIAGQGVNLGLRDVAALVEALADGVRLGLDPGDATILARYGRWRHFDGLQATTAFTALNALFSVENSALRGLRDAGLGIVDRLPGLKQVLVAEAAGLTGEVPRLLRGELP